MHVCYHSLKVAQQVGVAVKKVNQTLGIIKHTYTFQKKKVVVQLYKSLVRPHLGACIQACRPHLQKDMAALEKVQQKSYQSLVISRIRNS